MTIDGEDARDFDDAVYCERRRGGGWRLVVAIADVSHYVEVGSALDAEAAERGNSVYLPGTVVPMLPEALSNDLCSLRPKVDRLCMVCEMTIGARGRLTGYRFYEGVMHSAARLTYTRVAQLIEQGVDGVREDDPEIVGAARIELHELYRALLSARAGRGAVEFGGSEAQIVLDDAGAVEAVVAVERNDAHRLIEECMITANVAAAASSHSTSCQACTACTKRRRARRGSARFRARRPGPRGRDPDAQGIPGARRLRTPRSPGPPGDRDHGPAQHEAGAVHGRQRWTLRPRADRLHPLHVADPTLRRSAVHRAIRSVIRSKRESDHVLRPSRAKLLSKGRIYPYGEGELARVGEHISATERRADASRDMVDWLKCEWMYERLGEVFEGTVVTVTSFGLFVELTDCASRASSTSPACPATTTTSTTSTCG